MRAHRYFQRVMVTRVPSPSAESISNSLDEPLGAAQAEAEAAAGGVAVAQRQLDVGDAGPLVLEDQPQALAARRPPAISSRTVPPPP